MIYDEKHERDEDEVESASTTRAPIKLILDFLGAVHHVTVQLTQNAAPSGFKDESKSYNDMIEKLSIHKEAVSLYIYMR